MVLSCAAQASLQEIDCTNQFFASTKADNTEARFFELFFSQGDQSSTVNRVLAENVSKKVLLVNPCSLQPA